LSPSSGPGRFRSPQLSLLLVCFSLPSFPPSFPHPVLPLLLCFFPLTDLFATFFRFRRFGRASKPSTFSRDRRSLFGARILPPFLLPSIGHLPTSTRFLLMVMTRYVNSRLFLSSALPFGRLVSPLRLSFFLPPPMSSLFSCLQCSISDRSFLFPWPQTVLSVPFPHHHSLGTRFLPVLFVCVRTSYPKYIFSFFVFPASTSPPLLPIRFSIFPCYRIRSTPCTQAMKVRFVFPPPPHMQINLPLNFGRRPEFFSFPLIFPRYHRDP